MPITDDMELPIQKTKIAGPAVRGLELRKEDNNNQRASVAKFRQTYSEVKTKVIEGLKSLGSLKFS